MSLYEDFFIAVSDISQALSTEVINQQDFYINGSSAIGWSGGVTSAWYSRDKARELKAEIGGYLLEDTPGGLYLDNPTDPNNPGQLQILAQLRVDIDAALANGDLTPSEWQTLDDLLRLTEVERVDSLDIWRDASLKFAESAKGNFYAFVGDTLNSDGTYKVAILEEIEIPKILSDYIADPNSPDVVKHINGVHIQHWIDATDGSAGQIVGLMRLQTANALQHITADEFSTAHGTNVLQQAFHENAFKVIKGTPPPGFAPDGSSVANSPNLDSPDADKIITQLGDQSPRTLASAAGLVFATAEFVLTLDRLAAAYDAGGVEAFLDQAAEEAKDWGVGVPVAIMTIVLAPKLGLFAMAGLGLMTIGEIIDQMNDDEPGDPLTDFANNILTVRQAIIDSLTPPPPLPDIADVPQTLTFVALPNADRFWGFNIDDFIDDASSFTTRVYFADEGDDYVAGGHADDQIFGGLGSDHLLGGDGADVIVGDDLEDPEVGGNDIISGGVGNDQIDGGAGDDDLSGDENNDVILGGLGNDLISGGDGDDRINGGAGDDQLYGDADNDVFVDGLGSNSIDGGAGFDALSYSYTDDRVLIAYRAGTDPQTSDIRVDLVDLDYNGIDFLTDIERIEGTSYDDRLTFDAAGASEIHEIEYIDLTEGHDTLDFGNFGGPAYVGQDRFDITHVYADFNYSIVNMKTIIGMAIAQILKRGSGFTDSTDLRLYNFEEIIGSSQNDVLSAIWQLPDYNSLSPEDQALIDQANELFDKIEENDEILTPAERSVNIAQGIAIAEQVEGYNPVTISGRGGDDYLVGSRFESALDGGEGNDTLVGGGYRSFLTGGEGHDTFKLAPGSFAMDATIEDRAKFGAFNLTGGVVQHWSELGYAYWQPFSSILHMVPTISSKFTDLWVLHSLDEYFMSSLRYSLNSDKQLVVELGNQLNYAVIENYELDFDTGFGNAGITVFKVDPTESDGRSNKEFRNLIDLTLQQGFGLVAGEFDPLVIDLDGDGLELLRRGQRDAYFDFDADGFAERGGWVSADDGLLAIDLNGDGVINDIAELFGDETTAGLDQLAAYDSNADGVINASDALFGDLRIWQDLNGDAVTDPGELQDLVAHGITEISLTGTTPAVTASGNNTIAQVADVTFADGSTTLAGDVHFDVNQADSRYLGDSTVSPAAAALPWLKGFGDVTDLRVAMTNDAALLQLVTDFAALPVTTQWADYLADAADILIAWAGVTGVTPTPLGTGSFDLQKLAFLETFAGMELAPRDETTGDVLDANAETLEITWDDTLRDAAIKLVFQGPLSSHLNGISYSETDDQFLSATPTALADTLEGILNGLSADQATASADWTGLWGPALDGMTDSLTRADGIDARPDFIAGQLVRALDNTSATAVHPLTLGELATGLGLEDIIIGTGGADALSRAVDDNLTVFVGDAGNDTLTGGAGQDVYVFGENFGQDTVIDAEIAGFQSGDRLRFVHLNVEDVTITRDGVDLVITATATGDSVRVQNQFAEPTYAQSGRQTSANWGVEDIQFADGTIYEAREMASGLGMGTVNDDIINGSAFDDELTGLAGNDTLLGGDGGDIYIVGAGGGQDVIHDKMTNPFNDHTDLLFLGDGLRLDDLEYERIADSNDLLIKIAGTSDTILIKDQFYYPSIGYFSEFSIDRRIEALATTFDAPINWTGVQQLVIETYTTDGDDLTYGFGTADFFSASIGNDWMTGGDGGDIYEFGIGSGFDTIEDNQRYQQLGIDVVSDNAQLGADDQVLFGGGITAADVTFSRIGATDDLLITLAGSPDTLTVDNQFHGRRLDLFGFYGIAWADRIEEFNFEDGTTITWQQVLTDVTTGTAGADNLYGAHYADTLTGHGGNDFMSGGDDGDTYVYNLGDGNDVIEDNQYDIFTTADDVLSFGAGITQASLSFTHVPLSNDVTIHLGDGSTITLQNQFDGYNSMIFGVVWKDRIETLAFDDGSTMAWDDIMHTVIDQQETTGDDTIHGIDSDFGAWSDDINGGAGNDTIYGYGGGDNLAGGTGNDFIDGGWGSDTYTFNAGDGNDTYIDNGSGLDMADKVRIIGYTTADVTVTAGTGADDVILSFAGSSDTIEVQNALTGREYTSIETYEFDDATWTPEDLAAALLAGQATAGDDTLNGFGTADIIDGLAGNDTIDGGGGADQITGGLGNDMLMGGIGNDTYIFNAGDGQDTIDDGGDGLSLNDKVEIRGAAVADVTVTKLAGTNDVLFTFAGSSDQITVTNALSGKAHTTIESYIFDDGTVWTARDLAALVLGNAASSDADHIEGSSSAETISGQAGNDVILGGAGADTLSGDAGDDYIDGGTGNDTYIFNIGDGHDTIVDSGNGLDSADKLVIHGYTPTDVTVEPVRSIDTDPLAGIDMIDLVFAGGSDRITLLHPLDDGVHRTIETIEFDDGTVWTKSDLSNLVIAQLVSDGDDIVTGSEIADTIDAGDGDDIINGDDGADTLIGGLGSDTIDGGRGNDTIVFSRGDGQDTIVDNGDGLSTNDSLVIHGYTPDEVFVNRIDGSDDILLNFAGTEDSITLDHPITGSAHTEIESYIFDDGTVWTPNDLAARVLLQEVTDGDDVLQGYAQDDVINAGIGNDTIYGNDGADILSGDVGDDYLDGGKGNDTYVFTRSDGSDTFVDSGDGLSLSDKVLIHGYRPDEVIAQRIVGTDDILLTFEGTDDSITLLHPVTGSAHTEIETFEFDDGTVWTPSDLAAQVLAGEVTAGDDVLEGYARGDVISAGDGNDTSTATPVLTPCRAVSAMTISKAARATTPSSSTSATARTRLSTMDPVSTSTTKSSSTAMIRAMSPSRRFTRPTTSC